jgi:hypothetical protein
MPKGGKLMKEKDAAREERISMEAIVDAYGPEEQAMGWYYYLDDKISFPFVAECTVVNKRTPLEMGERVTVTKMSGEDYCERDMLVDISWKGKTLAIPLSQLKPLDADDGSIEVIGDWHYWIEQGYMF